MIDEEFLSYFYTVTYSHTCSSQNIQKNCTTHNKNRRQTESKITVSINLLPTTQVATVTLASNVA